MKEIDYNFSKLVEEIQGYIIDGYIPRDIVAVKLGEYIEAQKNGEKDGKK